MKTVELTSDSDEDDDQEPYYILHEMTQVIKMEPRAATIEEIELEEETSIMLIGQEMMDKVITLTQGMEQRQRKSL